MVRACLRCCWLVLWLWLPINQAGAEVLTLTQAEVMLPGLPASAPAPVNLPYQWDRHHRGAAGEAHFQIPFSLAAVPSEPYGLYIPRLGNAYAIWLNGALLEQNGDLSQGNGSDFAKAPRYLVLTPYLLSQHNLLQIHIRADAGRRGGLAPPVLGPHEEVYPRYLQDHRSRITGSFLVAVFGLLVGLVALALWATQMEVIDRRRRQRDPLYLYAAVAELCWAVSVSDVFIEAPPVPWPWWGMVILWATSLWILVMTLTFAELAGWRRQPVAIFFRWWLAVLGFAGLAVGIAVFNFGSTSGLTWLYVASTLTTLILAPLFIWSAVQRGSFPHRIMAGAMSVNVLVGTYDAIAFIQDAYRTPYLRYSSVLFGVSLAFIVMYRFRTASQQVVELNANLARQVAQKETELAASYQRLAQGVQEQARSGERSQTLRDMHDGVGSHISTAIRQLQSGRASGDEVLQTLRDSLDQLKLSIDAINLPPGDITALLANLRYRLEPRLRACGIELDWAVDALEPVAGLDSGAMRQLQFMLFEAISNVMQHARASQLRIEAQQTAQGARIGVVDNGCGFDVGEVARRGLRLMQERAQAIGAQLQIHSQPGRSAVELHLG